MTSKPSKNFFFILIGCYLFAPSADQFQKPSPSFYLLLLVLPLTPEPSNSGVSYVQCKFLLNDSSITRFLSGSLFVLKERVLGPQRSHL